MTKTGIVSRLYKLFGCVSTKKLKNVSICIRLSLSKIVPIEFENTKHGSHYEQLQRKDEDKNIRITESIC